MEKKNSRNPNYYEICKILLLPTVAFLWGYAILAADSRYVSKDSDVESEYNQSKRINDLDVRLARIEAKCDMIIERLKK